MCGVVVEEGGEECGEKREGQGRGRLRERRSEVDLDERKRETSDLGGDLTVNDNGDDNEDEEEVC